MMPQGDPQGGECKIFLNPVSHHDGALSDDDVKIALDLWDDFRNSCVEPGQALVDDVFVFQEQCLCFATIVLCPPLKEETKKRRGAKKWKARLQEGPNRPARERVSEIAQITQSSRMDDHPILPKNVFSHREDTRNDSGISKRSLIDDYTDSAGGSAMRNTVAWSKPAATPISVGAVYVVPPSLSVLSQGEVNVGLVISKEHQGKGYASPAIESALRWVFEELKLHRVQAVIRNGPNREHAVKLFTKLGFVHEGTRRRALMDLSDGGWTDVTYFAMLDTDWLIRAQLRKHSAPKSLWDEMFLRHQREREELVRWEENRLKRTASMETMRNVDVLLETPIPKEDEIPPIFDPVFQAEKERIRLGRSRCIFATPPLASESSDSEQGYYNTSSNPSDDEGAFEPVLMDASDLDIANSAMDSDPFGDSSHAGFVRRSPSPDAWSDSESEAELQCFNSQNVSADESQGAHSTASDVDSNWDMVDRSSEVSVSASDSEFSLA